MSKAYKNEETQNNPVTQTEFIIEDESENNRINHNFVDEDELE